MNVYAKQFPTISPTSQYIKTLGRSVTTSIDMMMGLMKSSIVVERLR